MIGLDTNVLIRYLTLDDPAQSPKAVALIERQLTESEPGFIGIVTMVEIVWVLLRPYGFSSSEVSDYIELLLRARTLVVEHAAAVYDAMVVLREERGDFADCLIATLGTLAGCARTFTFDRKASRLPGFSLLS